MHLNWLLCQENKKIELNKSTSFNSFEFNFGFQNIAVGKVNWKFENTNEFTKIFKQLTLKNPEERRKLNVSKTNV